MVYCWKCGSQVGEQGALCPKCGATLRGTMGVQSPTGFELLRDDKSIQNHWARRVLAILIDAAVVSLVVAVIAAIFASPFLLGLGFPVTAGAAFPSRWAAGCGGARGWAPPTSLVPTVV